MIASISGDRLDIYLSQALDMSRAQIKRMIDKGNVLVNGTAVKSGYNLKQGDSIDYQLIESDTTVKPVDLALDVISEDDNYIIVNKSQGMTVHPAVGHYNDTLVNALMHRYSSLSSVNGLDRCGIVHRLDKDTSGIIVVARNNAAHVHLASQIAARQVTKIYRGIVLGTMPNEGTIVAPLSRSSRDRKKIAVMAGGREAITDYKAVEFFDNYSDVEFSLVTGRTHQIRVHARHIGHPIAGDTVYGGGSKLHSGGQLLHAYSITFVNLDGRECTHIAPLPDYYQEVIRRLRK